MPVIDRVPRNKLVVRRLWGCMSALIVEAALVANFIPSNNENALRAAVAMLFISQISDTMTLNGKQPRCVKTSHRRTERQCFVGRVGVGVLGRDVPNTHLLKGLQPGHVHAGAREHYLHPSGPNGFCVSASVRMRISSAHQTSADASSTLVGHLVRSSTSSSFYCPSSEALWSGSITRIHETCRSRSWRRCFVTRTRWLSIKRRLRSMACRTRWWITTRSRERCRRRRLQRLFDGVLCDWLKCDRECLALGAEPCTSSTFPLRNLSDLQRIAYLLRDCSLVSRMPSARFLPWCPGGPPRLGPVSPRTT